MPVNGHEWLQGGDLPDHRRVWDEAKGRVDLQWRQLLNNDCIEISTPTCQTSVSARAASHVLGRVDSGAKDAALHAIAETIGNQSQALLAVNEHDLGAGAASGLDAALLDRLKLDPARIRAMSEGLRQIAALPDSVGEISELRFRPAGIHVRRMRVPLGVIGIIYESRPNVTANAAGLCLKAGNAAILRSGSRAIHTNRAIAACIEQGLSLCELPKDAVQVVEISDRAAVGKLIRMRDYVDVIVPRGGRD